MTFCYVCLGRFGDICNGLPLLLQDQSEGNFPTLCVASEFESITEGITYADKIVYPGHYSESQKAIQFAKRVRRFDKVIPLQCYGMDFTPKTDSFCKDAYELAGRLKDFRKYPLVFNNRSPQRESELVNRYRTARPMILVSTFGRSSPVAFGGSLVSSLQKEFGNTHNVLNLDFVKASRFYDLLGLFDVAKVLISIDTGHIHLARASGVPVISLITNKPTRWHGACPPENSIFSMRYDQFDSSKIIQAIKTL